MEFLKQYWPALVGTIVVTVAAVFLWPGEKAPRQDLARGVESSFASQNAPPQQDFEEPEEEHSNAERRSLYLK